MVELKDQQDCNLMNQESSNDNLLLIVDHRNNSCDVHTFRFWIEQESWDIYKSKKPLEVKKFSQLLIYSITFTLTNYLSLRKPQGRRQNSCRSLATCKLKPKAVEYPRLLSPPTTKSIGACHSSKFVAL